MHWLLPYAKAQQPGNEVALSAGMAKRNITPSPEVKNWVTGKPYAVIHDSIYVRALAIDDGTNKSVMINWEIVDAGESATDEIRNRISSTFGIPKHHILVNASHNHSAPWAPVFQDGLRGLERDSWWAVRYMPPQYTFPPFQAWMNNLMDQSLSAVSSALENMQTVSLWIGRSDISAFVQNRRPRNPPWGIVESNLPETFNYRHENWDPNLLGGGMLFGEVDRTMTILSFRNLKGANVASIVHLSAHAVSIYPFMDGISGDWPGEIIRKLSLEIGGQCMFLQGTAGDINPWRRGRDAVTEMAIGISQQAALAYKYSSRLQESKIINQRKVIGIPLTEKGKLTTGLEALLAEVQVIAIGPLAIVTLPGEPMTGLGKAIREQSPFPQTLVLGYSNGVGVYYVGLPGEKAYGGYESGEDASLGTDIAGHLLIETAVSLLKEIYKH